MSAQRSVRRVSLRPCPGEEADRTRPPSRARWRTAPSSTSHPCTTPAHRCWGTRLEKRGRHSSATRESFSPVWCLSARLTSQRLQRTASTRWWSAVRIWSWSSSRRMPGGCNMRALEVSKQTSHFMFSPKILKKFEKMFDDDSSEEEEDWIDLVLHWELYLYWIVWWREINYLQQTNSTAMSI